MIRDRVAVSDAGATSREASLRDALETEKGRATALAEENRHVHQEPPYPCAGQTLAQTGRSDCRKYGTTERTFHNQKFWQFFLKGSITLILWLLGRFGQIVGNTPSVKSGTSTGTQNPQRSRVVEGKTTYLGEGPTRMVHHPCTYKPKLQINLSPKLPSRNVSYPKLLTLHL